MFEQGRVLKSVRCFRKLWRRSVRIGVLWVLGDVEEDDLMECLWVKVLTTLYICHGDGTASQEHADVREDLGKAHKV